MSLVNIQGYNIKITYKEISTYPTLFNLIPLSIISKAKEIGYVYYDDFNKDLQYNIAVEIFKVNNIIRLDSTGIYSLDNSQLPFTDNADLVHIDEIDQDTMIDYFFRYNIEVRNLFITVYENEYQISILTPSVFMDSINEDITILQTDIEDFIVNTYRRYISTAYSSIPFMPWYGSRIKEYLHDLSIYQVEEVLQAEMNGITNMLKNYFIINNIFNYDFNAKVTAEENIEYGIVNYKIAITINDVQYTITIK